MMEQGRHGLVPSVGSWRGQCEPAIVMVVCFGDGWPRLADLLELVRERGAARGLSREIVERRVNNLSPVCKLQGCIFLLF